MHFKREDLQPVFSFKVRGAYNKMANLSAAERARGVITASAGNHAQGVACSAQKLGLRAVIVMPRTTPTIKVQAVQARGAEVVLVGDSYSDAQAHCDHLVAETGLTFIHPFDDPLVIAGQGTVGDEIVRHRQGEALHAVFVPVGGGGLLAGVAGYIKAVLPDVRVIGVEPFESDAMYQSLQAGRRVTLDHVGIFADGVAVRTVGVHTFQIAQLAVDEIVRVSNDEMCAAIKDIFDDTRSVMEPAGALVGGRPQALGRRQRVPRRAPGRDPQRRQHELRSAALRRRAGRARRGARGAVRRDDPGAARRLSRLLRRARPARRHRVQLPPERPPGSAHLRRRRRRLAARRGDAGARS